MYYNTSLNHKFTQLQTLFSGLKLSEFAAQAGSKPTPPIKKKLNQIFVPSPRMAACPNSDPNLGNVQQLQQLLQQQIRLRETIQRIRQVLDVHHIHRVAVQELLDFFKADWVFVLGKGPGLCQGGEPFLHPIGMEQSAALKTYLELKTAVAEQGQPCPIVVDGQTLQQVPMCQDWLSQYPGTWLLVPIYLMHAHHVMDSHHLMDSHHVMDSHHLMDSHQLQGSNSGEPWGLIAVGRKDQASRWSLVQQDQVKILVGEVAIALDHSLRQEKLKREKQELQALALTDSLTGLANRRQFDRYFTAEWQRLAREQQPLTLILCDIDYFKRYNDYYGHPTGDICLAQVSDVLRQCTRRPADLIARYGGEEFAVVLPNTHTEGGHKVALAIQAQLAKAALSHETSHVSSIVTLTMGIATVVPQPQLNPQDLLQAADLALYHAKQQGRDRIYVHAHYCVREDDPADSKLPKSIQPSLLDS